MHLEQYSIYVLRVLVFDDTYTTRPLRNGKIDFEVDFSVNRQEINKYCLKATNAAFEFFIFTSVMTTLSASSPLELNALARSFNDPNCVSRTYIICVYTVRGVQLSADKVSC